MAKLDYSEYGFIRVAAVSPEMVIGDPKANAIRILERVTELAEQRVACAVFPELCLSGYSAEDLFFSDALLQSAANSIETLCKESTLPLLIVGAPWRLQDGRLLNVAVAIGGSRVLGMVPKTAQPNYGEFYDLRWFVPGATINESVIHATLGNFQIRVDQLFAVDSVRVGIEICEDLWAPHSPATQAALAGAQILANLSASNELVSKADYRRDLVRITSAKNLCGYIYAGANATESSKDIVFGGHCVIADNGLIVAESDRFALTDTQIVTDIDCQRLQHDRSQNATFAQSPRPIAYRVSAATATQPLADLLRSYARHPFVPEQFNEFGHRAAEILHIQTTGLARRMLAASSDNLVIGLSGGLDSTLAMLVAADALDKLGLPSSALWALTLPGPGTSSGTLDNAKQLARAANARLLEISINAAVKQHLADLDHNGDHDVVFENAQARERTQILFNQANKVGGIVVGTGDLSELALGWCTYNADHMSNYNVNVSIPKTLVIYLVRWYAEHRANAALREVLQRVLATPISPELLPPSDDAIAQQTEEIVGPYELHDFFLYHFMRGGATPAKIYALAQLAFNADYAPATIKHWLGFFFQRFMTQQFKRTALPPGPKVGSVSLSPRGDWRMPDEASAQIFLDAIAKLD